MQFRQLFTLPSSPTTRLRYYFPENGVPEYTIPTAVYMTFFPNDETQILFSGFDDTPPILYHGLELTNVDLLSTLPWLNINNLKYK